MLCSLKPILWLMVASLLSALTSDVCEAAVLNVPSVDYPTIQAAIDAATGGDEIIVGPGTYHERILLDDYKQGVILRFLEGAEMTIIDGDGTPQAADEKVVEVSCILEAFEGFTIRNGDYDVFVNGTAGFESFVHNTVRDIS